MWSKEELNKEFPIGMFGFSISRKLYEEELSSPMCTNNFDDARMEELAKNIYQKLSKCHFEPNDKEVQEYAFWREMEDCALDMDMPYYAELDPDKLKVFDQLVEIY